PGLGATPQGRTRLVRSGNRVVLWRLLLRSLLAGRQVLRRVLLRPDLWGVLLRAAVFHLRLGVLRSPVQCGALVRLLLRVRGAELLLKRLRHRDARSCACRDAGGDRCEIASGRDTLV